MAAAAPDITSVFIREGDGTKGSVHFLLHYRLKKKTEEGVSENGKAKYCLQVNFKNQSDKKTSKSRK